MKRYFWSILDEHSSVHFKVKYFRISVINGSFSHFQGTIESDALFSAPEILLSFKVDSIQTQDMRIDAKIKSKKYLDAQRFPTIDFNAVKGCMSSSGGIRELAGNLIIKGITQPITLITNFSEIKKNNHIPTALFHLFGKIKLTDFSLVLPNVDDEILISVKIFIRQRK